ncbi:MAG: hypothetical protein V7L01_19000 [Nostoc sp.]|uniref:hypothetical protein n=1 Tax=Nostoc sp. TaxID=1180 RepID=UPI002FF85B3A
MTIWVWILGDQLCVKQAALETCFHQENVPVIFIKSLRHVQPNRSLWQGTKIIRSS